MNEITDLPNLFFILEELIKERCYTDEKIEVVFNKNIEDLANIKVWHHDDRYRCKCKCLNITEGESIEDAYSKYEKIKHVMKNGGLLNE
ncbi:hypothetical protein LAU42_07310 [Macrococcus armenti]|uniref:hypothetical protein n=1 Tax=Macrococcus armenti TaxID=2875764 RepID=UPI001CCDE302|nr:hypothetical protein [Macrococcus armenti]UBH21604.1 hypothetical protein LAU42_07310 [Macrococcus armenti]